MKNVHVLIVNASNESSTILCSVLVGLGVGTVTVAHDVRDAWRHIKKDELSGDKPIIFLDPADRDLASTFLRQLMSAREMSDAAVILYSNESSKSLMWAFEQGATGLIGAPPEQNEVSRILIRLLRHKTRAS